MITRTEKAKPPLQPEDTDFVLPAAWKSGSLKYDELHRLAEGGTAQLFTTFDKNLCREVAFKTLHEDLRNSEIETKRFVREARVTANIQHPGTLPVYELGRDREGNLFFTMKKVDGRDLRQILLDLAQEVPQVVEKFPLLRLLDILIQVCQTIAYAHEAGVIHRDLKPANVIVGKFGEVSFGLGTRQGPRISQHRPKGRLGRTTRCGAQPNPAGRHYGTPLYMSPEMAEGSVLIDERTDVFSLGIILFEILTLRPFLEGEDILEIKDKILNQPYPMPRELSGKHIPKDLEAVCIKALKRNKRKRYPKVSLLLEDLQRYRHGEEVSVYWYSGWEKLVRWNSRHAYSIIALLSALTGAGFWALFGP